MKEMILINKVFKNSFDHEQNIIIYDMLFVESDTNRVFTSA